MTDAGGRLTVIIQDRSRLFREGLALLLGDDDDVSVVALAETPDAFGTDRHGPDDPDRHGPDDPDRHGPDDPDRHGPDDPDVALVEAAGAPWDIDQVARRLVEDVGVRRVVGTVPDRLWRQVRPTTWTPVVRSAPIDELVAAIRGDAGRAPVSVSWRPGRRTMPAGLTGAELQVLVLISNGLSSSDIAARLRVGIKAVEHRRQSLFAKLGVQSQSQAVAVALRIGVLGPAQVSVAGS